MSKKKKLEGSKIMVYSLTGEEFNNILDSSKKSPNAKFISETEIVDFVHNLIIPWDKMELDDRNRLYAMVRDVDTEEDSNVASAVLAPAAVGLPKSVLSTSRSSGDGETDDEEKEPDVEDGGDAGGTDDEEKEPDVRDGGDAGGSKRNINHQDALRDGSYFSRKSLGLDNEPSSRGSSSRSSGTHSSRGSQTSSGSSSRGSSSRSSGTHSSRGSQTSSGSSSRGSSSRGSSSRSNDTQNKSTRSRSRGTQARKSSSSTRKRGLVRTNKGRQMVPSSVSTFDMTSDDEGKEEKTSTKSKQRRHVISKSF